MLFSVWETNTICGRHRARMSNYKNRHLLAVGERDEIAQVLLVNARMIVDVGNALFFAQLSSCWLFRRLAAHPRRFRGPARVRECGHVRTGSRHEDMDEKGYCSQSGDYRFCFELGIGVASLVCMSNKNCPKYQRSTFWIPGDPDGVRVDESLGRVRGDGRLEDARHRVQGRGALCEWLLTWLMCYWILEDILFDEGNFLKWTKFLFAECKFVVSCDFQKQMGTVTNNKREAYVDKPNVIVHCGFKSHKCRKTAFQE